MPQILKVNPSASLSNHSKRIRDVLEAGGVIAFPTDTYYGLGVDPFNEKGIRRIFEIKSRTYNKPLLVLIGTKPQINQLAESQSEEANKLIQNFWPASLTTIFDAVSELPSILTANTGKVGIRLPKADLVILLDVTQKESFLRSPRNEKGKIMKRDKFEKNENKKQIGRAHV